MFINIPTLGFMEGVMKYIKLKRELKQLARELKKYKHKRDHWYEYADFQGPFQYKVLRLAYDFRHRHIAYCMLRGRDYEEIEVFTKNPPDFDLVKSYMDMYNQKAMCVSS